MRANGVASEATSNTDSAGVAASTGAASFVTCVVRAGDAFLRAGASGLAVVATRFVGFAAGLEDLACLEGFVAAFAGCSPPGVRAAAPFSFGLADLRLDGAAGAAALGTSVVAWMDALQLGRDGRRTSERVSNATPSWGTAQTWSLHFSGGRLRRAATARAVQVRSHGPWWPVECGQCAVRELASNARPLATSRAASCDRPTRL